MYGATNKIFNFDIMIGVWRFVPTPPPLRPTAIFLFFAYASTTELSPPVKKLLCSLGGNQQLRKTVNVLIATITRNPPAMTNFPRMCFI